MTMESRKEKVLEIAKHAGFVVDISGHDERNSDLHYTLDRFAELIVRECMEQVEQAKNSPFVSLDDAKRMSHFVDVTKKKIQKHFGVLE